MAYTGNSIVDYLKSVGQDSSFGARKKIAASKGITNYTGTAGQNIQLLRTLRAPAAPAPTPVAPPSPTPVAAPSPAPTPTSVTRETPAGALPPLTAPPPITAPTPPSPDLPTPPTPASGNDFTNLRTALRLGLEEATQQQARARMTALSGLTEGGAAPSVIQAAIGLAQSGLRTSRETMFGDVITGFQEQERSKREEISRIDMLRREQEEKQIREQDRLDLLRREQEDRKQREMDSINQLRLDYGSVIGKDVTNLDEALRLIAPIVDAERKRKQETQEVELDTFVDENNNRVTVMYNPETRETRNIMLGKMYREPEKGGGGGGIDKEQQKLVLKQEGSQGIATRFEQIKGNDGFINPRDYKAAKSDWVLNGLEGDEFDIIFAEYRNPKDVNKGFYE